MVGEVAAVHPVLIEVYPRVSEEVVKFAVRLRRPLVVGEGVNPFRSELLACALQGEGLPHLLRVGGVEVASGHNAVEGNAVEVIYLGAYPLHSLREAILIPMGVRAEVLNFVHYCHRGVGGDAVLADT